MEEDLEIRIWTFLDGINDIFKKSNRYKKFTKLRKSLEDDQALKTKIKKLRSLEVNPYQEEYLALRSDIYQLPLVKEYKEMEHDLYYFSLEINQKLKELLPKRERKR